MGHGMFMEGINGVMGESPAVGCTGGGHGKFQQENGQLHPGIWDSVAYQNRWFSRPELA
jgi:hypothetical protein